MRVQLIPDALRLPTSSAIGDVAPMVIGTVVDRTSDQQAGGFLVNLPSLIVLTTAFFGHSTI